MQLHCSPSHLRWCHDLKLGLPSAMSREATVMLYVFSPGRPAWPIWTACSGAPSACSMSRGSRYSKLPDSMQLCFPAMTSAALFGWNGELNQSFPAMSSRVAGLVLPAALDSWVCREIIKEPVSWQVSIPEANGPVETVACHMRLGWLV